MSSPRPDPRFTVERRLAALIAGQRARARQRRLDEASDVARRDLRDDAAPRHDRLPPRSDADHAA
jgi:hypothetical protein